MKKNVEKIMAIITITVMLLLNILPVGANIVIAVENDNIESEEVKVELSQEVEKYFKLSETSLLLQQNIKVSLSKEANKIGGHIEVDAPKIGEKIPSNATVLYKGDELVKELYEFDSKTGKITIQTQDDIEETYKIIYEYNEINIENQVVTNLNAIAKIVIENIGEVVGENYQEVTLEEKGSEVTAQGIITKEAYKGYLYEGKEKETEYKEIYYAEISNCRNVENIVITNEQESFIAGEEYSTNQNLYYKETQINKDKMIDILGEEGIVKIENLETGELREINKDTEANELGNIVISYEGETFKKIKIETSKPEKIGTLRINNTKAIKAQTGFAKQAIKRVTALKEVIKINNSETVLEMQLLDVAPAVSLEINKSGLSTIKENKDLEIKAILESSNNKQELFENPEIRISMPEEVEQINIVEEPQLIQEDEMQVESYKVEGKDIIVKLKGEQTTYKTEIIKGAIIALKVNVTLNKKATNASKEITLTVTNASGNVATQAKPINILAPTEMIAINNIEGLGIETIGEEETTQKTIERGARAKRVTQTAEIINNTETEVKNVNILGELPTDEEGVNNLGAVAKNTITTQGREVATYYTANKNADEDLNDVNNGWTQQVEDISQMKKYLIVADAMQTSESLVMAYDMEVPENLDYNMEASVGYKVTYSKDEAMPVNQVKATNIKLTTGKGPVVEGIISATVGGQQLENGAKVKAGEVIKYKAQITNTGTEDASNVQLIASVPEETVYVEVEEGFEYCGALDVKENYKASLYYKETDAKQITKVIDSLKPEETKTIEYEVRVKADAQIGKTIEETAQIKYGDVTKETNKLTGVTEQGNLRVTFKRISDMKTKLTSYSAVRYLVAVENISDKNQENVKVKLNMPNLLQIETLGIREGTGDSDITNIEVTNEVNLGTIEKGKERALIIGAIVGDVENEQQELNNIATVTDAENKIYRSNVFADNAYGVKLDLKFTSNKENEYLKAGDIVEYKIDITNYGKTEISNAYINLSIPTEITLVEGKRSKPYQIIDEHGNVVKTITTLTEDGTMQNTMRISEHLDVNETATYTIKGVVDKSLARRENIEITSRAGLYAVNGMIKEIEIRNIIQKEEDLPDPVNPGGNQGEEQEDRYQIKGKAWLDENKNGQREDSEKAFAGLTVKALNTESSAIVATTTTEENGDYTLEKLPKGKYLVLFEYDTKQYGITTYQKQGVTESRNSNVISRNITIENDTKVYAVTDEITINDMSISNINIGLVLGDEFNLKLDKYITRVVEQNPKGTKVYTFGKEKLAKIEVKSKNMNNSKVSIEYQIQITNEGEVDGYVRDIIDYLPQELKFDSNTNKQWRLENGVLHNSELTNQKIAPKESKTVTLILTKDMNQNATGTFTNTAEIGESYNDIGLEDINSIGGNKLIGEDDTSSADLIISVSTGRIILYISLMISTMAIIITGIYFIKKKVLN